MSAKQSYFVPIVLLATLTMLDSLFLVWQSRYLTDLAGIPVWLPAGLGRS